MIRLLGAGLVTLAASMAGFGCASAVRTQCAQLAALIAAMDYMKSEMSARLTPLPVLFSTLGASRQKDAARFFEAAGRALATPPGCTIPVSFRRGFQSAPGLRPGQDAVQALYTLSMGLGQFELEAQLRAVETCRERLAAALLSLQAQKRARCRSYETIGICAGLALAVILL